LYGRDRNCVIGGCCQKATRFYQVLTAKGQELEAGVTKSASQVAGKRRARRIYSLEAQFVQRQAKSIFQGAPLGCALGLRQSGVECCHCLPQHLATPPREERVAVSHVLGYRLPSRYAGLERSWSESIANRTSA